MSRDDGVAPRSSLRHPGARCGATVKKVDITRIGEIVAVCYRGRERQAIPIPELPLPDPRPAGWEWIEAIAAGPEVAGGGNVDE